MEDNNSRISSIEERLVKIESIIQNQIFTLASEHTELLQKISDKLNVQDNMFVETANNVKDIASHTLTNTNSLTEHSEHIISLYNSSTELNNSITDIYKDLTSIYNKLNNI
ncbi:hypothetical protein CMU45_02875 [Elizabethkingia anophelis]|nr:hypothetical protein [Elizabethkingia anophelis]MDV3814224.1 hypothetical protein [Elizabethkingia anophelis]